MLEFKATNMFSVVMHMYLCLISFWSMCMCT